MSRDGDEFGLLQKDLDTLRAIGREKGFPIRLRKKIWAILLGVDLTLHPGTGCSDAQEPHEDEKQVLLDTNRSMTGCLPAGVSKDALPELKHDLQDLIAYVLRKNKWLHYYQGYHDIAQLMLFTMGKDVAKEALERLSIIYLRDFMLSTLAPSMSMLRLVHEIIAVADPEYSSVLNKIEPYYAISALLTWWTHSIESYQSGCRLFDYLLCGEPVLILYTIAAVTMLRKEEAYHDLDQDMIFHVLSKDLKSLDVEKVISLSTVLYDSVKPRQLRHWRQVSQHSCMKTFTESQRKASQSNANYSDWAELAHSHVVAQEKEFAKAEVESMRKSTQRSSTATYGALAIGVSLLAAGVAWYYQAKD